MTKISEIDNIHLIHDNGLDYNNNEIYLMGEGDYVSATGVDEVSEPGVEFLMAKRFIKNIKILSMKSDEVITIHLKSCGGMWEDGIAIYDAIKSCKNHINIINYAEARSMSSLIYLAGDTQLIHKHGKFMFHSGTIHTGGTIRQFRTEYEENEKSMNQMLDIYVNHLNKKPYWEGLSDLQIRNWLIGKMDEKEEVYLSAEEAIEIGFADQIIENY